MCPVVLASWRLYKCEMGVFWGWVSQGVVPGTWPWGSFRGAPGWRPVASVLVGGRWWARGGSGVHS